MRPVPTGNIPRVLTAISKKEPITRLCKLPLPTPKPMQSGLESACRLKLNLSTGHVVALSARLIAGETSLSPAGNGRLIFGRVLSTYQNTGEDGFRSTSPVGSFPPNGFGLFDMTGNVWEWCQDWYRADYYDRFKNVKVADNPQGPADSFDPLETSVPKRVQRGGSFMCTDQYCARYFVGARGKGEPDSGCCNVGFRCARD